MTAFYSEFDPKAAAWLRELIKQGLIADGTVDERDLWDVSPADLVGFTQVHLCAGIGVWSYALRRAGWADDRPVWTGSFPCQPFSSAGKGEGFADERHLWPAGQWLIEQCRPAVIFGEQVANKDAEPWLDLVQADLEALAYAVGAVPFPSAGIGAPHIRDRLYWVADAASGWQSGGAGQWRSTERPSQQTGGLEGRGQPGRERAAERPAGAGSVVGGLAQPRGERRDGERLRLQPGRSFEAGLEDGRNGEARGLADASGDGCREERSHDRGQLGGDRAQGLAAGLGAGDVNAGFREPERHLSDGARAQGEHGLRKVALRPGPVNGKWGTADWLYSRDGSWRPVEPGTFPLAHGAPARVGRLRGYGNAINAEAAVAWIESYLEAIGERAYVGGAEETPAVRA
ncbi:MAG: DNA cytosine methyltransferase [Gemmatimonadales bacterium]|nr:DNA cytosine methyltransferase [Gemmatimonadales bacterium]